MEKELIHLFEGVQKAADALVDDIGPEEDRALDLLNQLKKFPVNYHVLVSTQVGKRLRALTKHHSCRIKVLASEVVEIWKDVIVQETARNRTDGAAKDEGSVKVGAVKVERMPLVKSRKDNPAYTNNYKKIKIGGHNKRMKTELDAVKTEKGPVAALQIKVQKTITEDDQNFRSLEQIKEERTCIEKKSMDDMSSKVKVEMYAVKTEERLAAEQIKVEKVTAEDERSLDQTEENKATYAMSHNRKQDQVTPPKLDSIVYCNDPMRNKIREMLAEALCKVSREVDKDLEDAVNRCDPYRVAVSVETAMFEKWGKTNCAHKLKYRSIIFNMKDQKNPDFRRKVLFGQFVPDAIIELTPEQMASDAMQEKNEHIKQKALFECERGQSLEATCEKFKCGRCGKRETTYYQMQTRSADEPMTTYVTCVNCSNRWKFC
ncbi:general transcription factor [Lithospermum erythrorhizon]|uniref:General transcription factor n=1 Tax=Lithospermum erythrorhizon TaxID=34254 RepID=A0AAV3QYK3_LITER